MTPKKKSEESESSAPPKAKDDASPAAVEVKKDPPKVTKPEVKKEEPAKPEQRVSFDRWFAHKSFKPHWKRGMAAYTNVDGRRTLEDWDLLFKRY